MKDCFIIESKDLFGVLDLDGEFERCIVEYKDSKGVRRSKSPYKVEWMGCFITCERDIPNFYA